jgi:hypothetical protein
VVQQCIVFLPTFSARARAFCAACSLSLSASLSCALLGPVHCWNEGHESVRCRFVLACGCRHHKAAKAAYLDREGNVWRLARVGAGITLNVMKRCKLDWIYSLLQHLLDWHLLLADWHLRLARRHWQTPLARRSQSSPKSAAAFMTENTRPSLCSRSTVWTRPQHSTWSALDPACPCCCTGIAWRAVLPVHAPRHQHILQIATAGC